MSQHRGWFATGMVAGLAVLALVSASARSADPVSDFGGTWRLDPARSDAPRFRGEGMPGGMRGGPRMGDGPGMGERPGRGEGPREGGGPPEGGPGGRPAGRGRPLPDLIHVTQTTDLVSVEDSTGAAVLEIATVPTKGEPGLRAPGARHESGTWRKQGLVVNREGPRGGSLTETWSLGDGGRTLTTTVEIHMGDMGTRTIRRVYTRVARP